MASSEDDQFWLSLLGELGSPSDLAPVQQQNDDSYLYVDVLPSSSEAEQTQNYFTEYNDPEPQYSEPPPEVYYPPEETLFTQHRDYNQSNHYEWNDTRTKTPSPPVPDLFADDPRNIWHPQSMTQSAVREESESLFRERESFSQSFSQSSKIIKEAVETLVEIPLRHDKRVDKAHGVGEQDKEVEYYRLNREESLFATTSSSLTQDRGRNVAVRASATLASTGLSISSAVGAWTVGQLSVAYRVLLTRLGEQQQLMLCAGLVVQTLQVARNRLEELITAHLVTVLTADDPETRHLRLIQSTDAWRHIALRCAMASLPWRQKQLLVELRDTPTDQSIDGNEDNERTALQTDLKQILRLREVSGLVEKVSTETVHMSLPLQDPEGLLVAAAEGQEAQEMQEEAIQYALARFFTPPSFHEQSSCSQCHGLFGVTLFRHHCRCCGRSFCETHSSQRRRIFRYGYVQPVRVCDVCAVQLDELYRVDQLLFRDARILAYFSNTLIPFTTITSDRAIDKALRVADYSFAVARNTLALNFPTKVVFETIDVLKRYGLSGFAGLLLRKDFMEAIETLKNVVGMDRLLTILSLHELTACVYYKLAIDRGLRGCLPDAELEIHADTRFMAEQDADSENEQYTCYPALSHDVDMAIRFAPLALEVVYLDNAADMRRLGILHRLELLCCNADDERAAEQPCYALYATHAWPSSQQPDKKQRQELEVVLAIRGTHSVQDVVTDIRSMPQAFPPPQDVIDACLGGVLPSSYLDAAVQQQAMLATFLDASEDGNVHAASTDAHSKSSSLQYACGGMARAALRLLSEIGPALRRICESSNNKCVFWLTGHSMGGGVAALLTLLMKRVLPTVTVKSVVFGCPSCVSSTLSDELRSNCVSVVLRDDVVTRITPQSIRALLVDILRFRRCVFRHIQQDWSDVMLRAKEVWAPRTRRSAAYDSSNREQVLDLAEELLLKGNNSSAGESGERLQGLEADDMQIVAPALLQPLWQPGRVIHIYSLRGQLQAAEVSRSFPALRSIAVQGHIFEDHRSERIFQALLEVRAPRRPPPLWTAFDRASTCTCCQSPFTWHSTFRGAAQEFRDRYNCRNCGSLVCGPCSQERRPVPRLGMLQPRRLCDRCFLSGDYALM